jgi:hypothetical protein
MFCYRCDAHEIHGCFTRLSKVEFGHFELVLGGLEVSAAVVWP